MEADSRMHSARRLCFLRWVWSQNRRIAVAAGARRSTAVLQGSARDVRAMGRGKRTAQVCVVQSCPSPVFFGLQEERIAAWTAQRKGSWCLRRASAGQTARGCCAAASQERWVERAS